jgi:type I restriction enzyme R subunit
MFWKYEHNMGLTKLLYKNGYPPQQNDKAFEKVIKQAENFKNWTE